MGKTIYMNESDFSKSNCYGRFILFSLALCCLITLTAPVVAWLHYGVQIKLYKSSFEIQQISMTFLQKAIGIVTQRNASIS